MTSTLAPSTHRWPQLRLRPDGTARAWLPSDRGPCTLTDIVWGTKRPRAALDAQRPGTDLTLPRVVVAPGDSLNGDLRRFAWRWLTAYGIGADGRRHGEQRIHFLACGARDRFSTPDFDVEVHGGVTTLTMTGTLTCECGEVEGLEIVAQGAISD